MQNNVNVPRQEGAANAKSPDQMSRKEQEHQKLREIPVQFAGQIPGNIYSPAEIRDYLFVHIDDPKSAVGDFGAWKTRMTVEYKAAKQMKIRDERAQAARIGGGAKCCGAAHGRANRNKFACQGRKESKYQNSCQESPRGEEQQRGQQG